MSRLPDEHAAAVPALRDGHRGLQRLVQTPVDEFAQRHWSQSPLLSKAATLPSDFSDLFSARAVDELLATRALRTPFLRMAKDGSTLPSAAFARGGGIGAAVADQASEDSVLRHFADGATLVLQGLHRLWAPVIDFSQALAAELGHPVQVNAYVTPPQSTGFSDHYDVHDVFVLQVAGEKRWRIRPPVLAAPLRDQPWTARRAEVERAAEEAPLIEETLEPGDCLYLPRGYLHSATALGGTSIHLTIGVHAWTTHHVAEELVRRALAGFAGTPAGRASLPLGVDLAADGAPTGVVEQARAALLQALAEVDPDSLRPALAETVRAAQRPAPLAALAQATAARDLKADQRVMLRAHLSATLEPAAAAAPWGASGAVLHSRTGRLDLTADEMPVVQSLLGGATPRVADLGADLARRLLLAGVVHPA